MSDMSDCPGCGVEPGKKHAIGCDVERCSCGKQRITCSARHKRTPTWDGVWPGVKECQDRGWYCQDFHGPSAAWGSFCPCSPDAPGAMPDLNRLAYFQVHGKDELYKDCTRVPMGAEQYEAARKRGHMPMIIQGAASDLVEIAMKRKGTS